MAAMRRFCFGLVLALFNQLTVWSATESTASSPVAAPPPLKASFCLDCHSDKTLCKTNATGQAVSLFIDEARFHTTVHKTNSCVSCHSDVTVKHPDDNVVPKLVNCSVCHES